MADRPGVAVVPSMRVLLIVASVLVLLAGLPLFVFPADTERYFAWTVASPMTATFLGAAYWSALVLELAAASARSWDEARIAVPAVFVFTALTLVVTLIHLDLFHLDGSFETRTRVVAIGWVAVYVVVPLAMLVVTARQSRQRPPRSSLSLPRTLRVLLAVQAAALLGLGAALLVAPTWADAAWPWPLTPLTGRAVGAWLVGLGVASAHAVLVDAARSLWPLGLAGGAFAVLETVALVRYGDELSWGSVPAATYVAGLALIGVTGGWLLRVGRRAVTARQPRA